MYQTFTTDEFHAALMACNLPLYAGYNYIACWLAPDGRILVSDRGHHAIASAVMTENDWLDERGYATYEGMHEHGYFRLTPFNKRRGFGLEGFGKLTTKQKATVAMFLRLWTVDEQTPGYLTCAKSGELSNRQAHNRADFLTAMQEMFN